jgi:hypothetical protein
MKNQIVGLKDIDNQDVVDLVDESMRISENPAELFDKLMSDLMAWGEDKGYIARQKTA